MKTIALILFIICTISKLPSFSQALFEKESKQVKEAAEIDYIVVCLKGNKSLDSLIEWEFSSKNDSLIVFKLKRGRIAFFVLHEDSGALFLKAIDYYHNSFEKLIFSSKTLREYEITNKTKFRVLMSIDKLRIYFCIINPDNIAIWVLSNGSNVNTYKSTLN